MLLLGRCSADTTEWSIDFLFLAEVPVCLVMSKKLIEFLVYFSDFYYNVIACFYA